MHSDHETFVRGIELQRRLKVTYFRDERREKLAKPCGPLYYSRGKAEADELERYYLWDFAADEGYNFMALSPGQIVSMEMTEDPFTIDEVSGLSKRSGKLTQGPGTLLDR